MGMFGRIFGIEKNAAQSELDLAVERAVSSVQPLLKNTRGYPNNFQKPVACALDYAHSLAASLPQPITIDRKAFALDPLVHALFPSVDTLLETLRSSESMRDYRRTFPTNGETYALMGMRRMEKTMIGMELDGDNLRKDVLQHAVYFTSHTLENPAQSEEDSRRMISWSFFDSLTKNVARRASIHRQAMQALLLEKDLLSAKMQGAETDERERLEKDLLRIVNQMQSASRSLDLSHYPEDFEEVLLNPQRHLRMDKTVMPIDDMGIVHEGSNNSMTFNELIGYDRRRWTVTLVHCRQTEFDFDEADEEAASRKLAL